MKLAFLILALVILTFGFVIGAILGVEVVKVDVPEVPTETMYSFIVSNASLLGSISSFLALIFAIGLFIGWKQQQHQILLISQKREILERLARLASSFRLHIMCLAFNNEESEFFEKKLFVQMLELNESITVYYALFGLDENIGTFADNTLKKTGDFLDGTKDYYSFICDYVAKRKTGCLTYSNKRIGYNINNITNDISKEMFAQAKSDEYYKYLSINVYSVSVSKCFDKAAKSIKKQLSKIV